MLKLICFPFLIRSKILNIVVADAYCRHWRTDKVIFVGLCYNFSHFIPSSSMTVSFIGALQSGYIEDRDQYLSYFAHLSSSVSFS